MGLVFFCLFESRMGKCANQVLFNTSCDKSADWKAGTEFVEAMIFFIIDMGTSLFEYCL